MSESGCLRPRFVRLLLTAQPAFAVISGVIPGVDMTEYSEARRVAAMLSAVAEPTRLRVLWYLARGPMHVGALSDAIGIKMVNMSHHLGVMRQSGILDDSKDGRRVIYKLRSEIFSPGTSPDVLGTLTLGNFRMILWAKTEPPPNTSSKKSRKKK